MNAHLEMLVGGATLSDTESESLFDDILTGALDEAQIGAALALMQVRGPTVDEIVGAARSMRTHVSPIPVSTEGRVVVDTCGTGGAPKTFNVSTIAAIVAASASDRLVIAKHGNRSRTGRGSAEVLQALGVDIDASPDVQAACLDACGVCFCFAVHHHPAMKHAIGARRSLGFPTIFNLLGPLTNPARATRQVIGVYAPHLVETIANALLGLGAERAIVAHSEDGLDELTTTAPTRLAHVRDGGLSFQTFDASSLGMERASIDDLRVHSLDEARDVARSILEGQPGPRRDMVALSAGAALVVAGVSSTLADGVALATSTLEEGRAKACLDTLVRVSNRS